MARPVSASERRLLQLAATAAVVAYAVAAVVLPHAGSPPTTYGAAWGFARACDLAAGLGLLAAGLLALTEPSRRRAAVPALAAGVLWLGPDWEGWDHGPALVRSLGAVAPPLFLAVAFHLALSFPNGRLRARPDRAAVWLVYAAALVVSVGRALVRDPFLDPRCWRNCLDNSFLVHADAGLAGAFDDAGRWFAVAAGVALAVLCGRRLLTARPAVRPGLAAGACVGLAAAAFGAALVYDPGDDPRQALDKALFVALALSVLALAAAVGWGVAAARRTRASVRRLEEELAAAPQPGGLEAALAAALGDPSLEVRYPVEDMRRFVDGSGRPSDPPAAGDARAVLPVTRGGELVAVVVHDAALDGPDLAREIGSAARLAVDNERLHAEVLARLEELRASRARIVAAGDRERRRLERNLHDGAQQRLLALSYGLRLARADAGPELAALLAESEAEAQGALDELRHLAQGIYPAILAEAGLAAALATLADTAPIPVELGALPAGRRPAPVETAAYVTVAEAVGDAVARGATFVGVEVRFDGVTLVLELRDDATPRDVPVHTADRVGALGGSVSRSDGVMRAELPCA